MYEWKTKDLHGLFMDFDVYQVSEPAPFVNYGVVEMLKSRYVEPSVIYLSGQNITRVYFITTLSQFYVFEMSTKLRAKISLYLSLSMTHTYCTVNNKQSMSFDWNSFTKNYTLTTPGKIALQRKQTNKFINLKKKKKMWTSITFPKGTLQHYHPVYDTNMFFICRFCQCVETSFWFSAWKFNNLS